MSANTRISAIIAFFLLIAYHLGYKYSIFQIKSKYIFCTKNHKVNAPA